MNFLTNLIDVSLVFYFLLTVFKPKVKRSNLILGILILVLINTFNNTYFGLAIMWVFFIIITLTAILFSFISKVEIINSLLISFVATALMFIIEMVTLIIMVFSLSISSNDILEVSIYKLVGILITKVLYFLVIRYIISRINIKGFLNGRSMYPLTVILFFNLIIIYMTFILFFNLQIDSIFDYISIIGMAVGAIVFSWLVFMLMKRLMEQSQQELLWRVREKEYQNQRAYFENLQQVLTTMKAQRHDFNNHLTTIYGMIQLDKIQEAKKFILSLGEKNSTIDSLMDVKHPVIHAIVSIKKERAREINIPIELDVSLDDDLPYDYIDLSIILGNLLDNAIEANKKIGINLRSIKASLVQEEGFLSVCIQNSKPDTETYQESEGKSKTSKGDWENHGFGLYNVKQVVAKYKGLIDIKDLGKIFEVHIKLPL